MVSFSRLVLSSRLIDSCQMPIEGKIAQVTCCSGQPWLNSLGQENQEISSESEGYV